MPSEHVAETSPLLGEDHSNRGDRVHVNYQTAGGSATGNGDEETQQSESRNYEGLPEAQAQLKYILPAVAIGVRALPICR